MNEELDLRALGARAVLDLRSQSRVLGSLWRHQPAVVVWLRHFACLFCKEQAALARADLDAIERLGARLAFVGSGTTAQALDFRDKYAPDCAVYTDPSSYTYRTIGARESLVSTVAGMVVNSPRAMRGGHFQTRVHRRPFQQGGVLVAMPDGTIPYRYVSRIAGDHPPMAEVVTALAQAHRQSTDRAAVTATAWRAAPATSSRPAPFEWSPPPEARPVARPAPSLPAWPAAPAAAALHDQLEEPAHERAPGPRQGVGASRLTWAPPSHREAG